MGDAAIRGRSVVQSATCPGESLVGVGPSALRWWKQNVSGNAGRRWTGQRHPGSRAVCGNAVQSASNGGWALV